MAATLSIVELNGVTPIETAQTTIYFGTDDNSNPIQAGLAEFYPIALPASGYNYSYWKHISLKATGTFTDIRNIRWYIVTDPAWGLGTGGAKLIANRDSGDVGCPSTSYQQGSGTQNTTGNYLADATSGHAYYRLQTTPIKNWGNWTLATPATVDSSFYTAAFTSKSAVLQLKVAPDASAQSMTGGQMAFKAQVVS